MRVLNTPTAVLTLSARSLPKLPLSVEELYRQGQTNTDAEPFAEHFEVDEVVHGLEGESFFIASKASNFDALVPSLIGPAPFGVVFAIPNRHTLLYAIVDQDDWMTPVIGSCGLFADWRLWAKVKPQVRAPFGVRRRRFARGGSAAALANALFCR